MLPSLFPSCSGKGLISTPVYRYQSFGRACCLQLQVSPKYYGCSKASVTFGASILFGVHKKRFLVFEKVPFKDTVFRRNLSRRCVTAYGVMLQTTEFFSKSADKTSDFSTACFLNEWQDHNVICQNIKNLSFSSYCLL